nr:MAG TPA: hypothetical protein [Caudoviricetes sp.]
MILLSWKVRIFNNLNYGKNKSSRIFFPQWEKGYVFAQ